MSMADTMQDRNPALTTAPAAAAVPATGHAATHALDIDFARGRQRLTALGTVLLLAGACLAAVTALDYEEAAQAVQEVQQQADRLQRAGRPAERRVAARQGRGTAQDSARLQAQRCNAPGMPCCAASSSTPMPAWHC